MRKRFSFFLNFCALLSGVIGAGFATGQELYVYFDKKNPIFVGLCCAFFYYCFFLAAIKADDFFKRAEGKGRVLVFAKKFMRCLTLFSCLVVLCVMLAGVKATLYELIPDKTTVAVTGVLTALFCVFLVCFDKKGFQTVGVFFTPVVIGCLLFLFAKISPVATGELRGSVKSSFLYASLNSIFLTTFVADACNGYAKGMKTAFCLVSALACGVLVTLAASCVTKSGYVEIPLVKLAYESGVFGKVYCIVVLLGIVTTVCASALPLAEEINRRVNCRFLSVVLLFGFCQTVSFAGFSHLVKYCYPAISVLGVALLGFTLFCTVKYREKRKKAFNFSI